MAVAIGDLTDDLLVETAALDELLTGLTGAAWDTPTPAPGWAVRDQVSHLAYFDDATTMAVTDPEAFACERDVALVDIDAFTARVAAAHRSMPGTELLEWFHRARGTMIATLVALAPSTRVPWYGPDMSLASALTARIMETFAHGRDIADALRAPHPPTGALRHVAHLGARTLRNSYDTHGLPVPTEPVRVELSAPDGARWTWGDDDGSANSVVGPALDFCLVVTQRRHPDDTALVATGPVATEWLSIAQAFAGPPGAGRAPDRSRDRAPRSAP